MLVVNPYAWTLTCKTVGQRQLLCVRCLSPPLYVHDAFSMHVPPTGGPGSMAASERTAAQGAALAMDAAGLQSRTSEAGSSDEEPASTVGSLLGPTQVNAGFYCVLPRTRC